MDGPDYKVFGVFDGHGIYGHVVSGFAAGIMLDYIRNKNSKAFSPHKIGKLSEKEITKSLRKCFKYT